MALPSNPPATTSPTALKTWMQNVVDTVTDHESDVADLRDGYTATGEQVAPDFKATGKTGATTSPGILGGGTNTGAAPASGAHVVGELVIGHDGKLWVCTTAGTPGTWTRSGGFDRIAETDETQYNENPGAMVLPTGSETVVSFEVQAPDTEAGAYGVIALESDEEGSAEIFVYGEGSDDAYGRSRLTAHGEDAGTPSAQMLVEAGFSSDSASAGLKADLFAAAASLTLEFGGSTGRVLFDTDGMHVNPDAADMGFNGETPVARPNVTGSRGGNAALASLLTALDTLGLITDSTS